MLHLVATGNDPGRTNKTRENKLQYDYVELSGKIYPCMLCGDAAFAVYTT
jgi:hypothetical protein